MVHMVYPTIFNMWLTAEARRRKGKISPQVDANTRKCFLVRSLDVTKWNPGLFNIAILPGFRYASSRLRAIVFIT